MISAKVNPTNSPMAFLSENTDLIGLEPDVLDEQLRERLKTSPIYCHTILDGLTLFRALLPNPDEYVDCHYALLMKDQAVLGITCLTSDIVDSEREEDYLPANTMNARYLISHIIESGATSVLLASTRLTTDNTFSSSDLLYIQKVSHALGLMDVDLLDWMIIIPSENASWRWQVFGEDAFAYMGISSAEFDAHGTEFSPQAC